MFGDKFPKLTSAIGRETHSDDEMTELNAQILDRGVKGLAIVRQTDLVQKETELNAALAAARTAQEELATATADRDSWQKKAEEYGAQPGAVKTNVKVKKDKDADGGYKSDPTASYNQRANTATGRNPVAD